jgi:hypothetical protein
MEDSMRFHALVNARYATACALACTVFACTNGIEIPDGAVSLKDSPDFVAAVEKWQLDGFGDASHCPAPYALTVSADEFEDRWRELGGDPNNPSCGRHDGSVNKDGQCLGAFTQVDDDASEHSSVTYIDAAWPIDSSLLQHEIRHVLYACVRGHNDALHLDRPVWAGDPHAIAGE